MTDNCQIGGWTHIPRLAFSRASFAAFAARSAAALAAAAVSAAARAAAARSVGVDAAVGEETVAFSEILGVEGVAEPVGVPTATAGLVGVKRALELLLRESRAGGAVDVTTVRAGGGGGLDESV